MAEVHLGPIDYVVVEFTDPATLRDGFDRLLGLVERGLIQVLDLEFVANTDGARVVDATEISADFAQFAGACSGLLDQEDLDTVAAALAPDTSAAVLVYEELAIVDVITAWEDAGSRIVAEGPVDVDDIGQALDGISS